MYSLRIYIFLIVASFTLTACEDKTLPELNVNSGDKFPEIQLSDLHAKPVLVNHDASKIRIINIWATWCGPCRHELPSLQRLSDKLDKKRFQVIGVSIDYDDHLVREYLLSKNIHYDNYIDMEMTLSNELLGVRIFPSTYLVRADGSIAEIIEGWREWDSPEIINKITGL